MEVVINCTKVNGSVVRIPYEVLESAKQELTDDKSEDDPQGAMQFIVATVLVYSILGVFCTLINRIRRLRGKSHENYVQDESVSKYLKKEKNLKMDGRKMKLMYECNLVVDKVKRFEEKQQLLELEKGMTSDFTKESISKGREKKQFKKRKHDIGNTLGKMGASLFFFGSNHSLNTNNNHHNSDDANDEDDMTSPQKTHVIQGENGEYCAVDVEINKNDVQEQVVTTPLSMTMSGSEADISDAGGYFPYHCTDV